MDASQIIDILDLKPLPGEGGFFRETYRSRGKIPGRALGGRYGCEKAFCTAIYYLLTPETCSALHRLPTDEVLHFYLGDPVTLYQFGPGRAAQQSTLGQNLEAGERVQSVVPAGTWQGMALKPGGNFALMGTTVAPGFDFQDLELADRQTLVKDYPDHANVIRRLTESVPPPLERKERPRGESAPPNNFH